MSAFEGSARLLAEVSRQSLNSERSACHLRFEHVTANQLWRVPTTRLADILVANLADLLLFTRAFGHDVGLAQASCECQVAMHAHGLGVSVGACSCSC